MKPETEGAIRQFSETAEGWCSTERALEMAELVIETKPQTIVEIGVFAGGSTIPQALALKEMGAGKIYGIDPWSTKAAVEQIFTDGTTPREDEEIARKWWSEVDLNKMHLLCMEAIWRYELEAQAVIIRAGSEVCAELFTSIDILYIDGNHSEVASCRDVNLYVHRVKRGGHIFFDDAHWLSTQAALRLLENQADLEKDAVSYRLYRKR